MSRLTRPGMNTQNRENTHKSIEIGNRKSHQPHVPANTPGHEQTQQIIKIPVFNHHTHAQNNCLQKRARSHGHERTSPRQMTSSATNRKWLTNLPANMSDGSCVKQNNKSMWSALLFDEMTSSTTNRKWLTNLPANMSDGSCVKQNNKSMWSALFFDEEHRVKNNLLRLLKIDWTLIRHEWASVQTRK